MLFPVNKQLAFNCVFTAVWSGTLVLQLSVRYCNDGRVISPEMPLKKRVPQRKQEKSEEVPML